MADKEKAPDQPEKKKRKKKDGKKQIFLIVGLLMGVIFLPTAILLAVGMLPTPMSVLVDKTKQQAKLIAIGSMNLAGCSPFVVELWKHGNSFEKSFSLLMEPMTLVVMYGLAAAGYVINWAVTGMVAQAMQQRGMIRQKDIIARQAELVERWGQKVTGEIKLNSEGFPFDEAVVSRPADEDQDID